MQAVPPLLMAALVLFRLVAGLEQDLSVGIYTGGEP